MLTAPKTGAILVSYQANNGISLNLISGSTLRRIIMDIFNTTTQQVVTLKLEDPASGVNMVADYTQVGDDLNMSYNDDMEMMQCDSDTIEWWQDIIAQYQKMENRMYDIKKYGSDDDRAKLDGILEDYEYVEFNDRAGYINQALDDAGIE